MLHEVLALAVLVALNPVLLAFTLLVISRPRTVPNLLAFWLGSLMVNVPAFLIALCSIVVEANLTKIRDRHGK